jgi:hypothetical protein
MAGAKEMTHLEKELYDTLSEGATQQEKINIIEVFKFERQRQKNNVNLNKTIFCDKELADKLTNWSK